MSSDIDIASNALLLIGANTISSFTEPGAGATVAANLYEDTVRRLLSEHYWRFAMKKQKLNRTTNTPINQYQNEFQVPTDMITVMTIRPFSNYQIFEDKLYSNLTDIDMDYIYRVPESAMPPYFTKAIEYKLAADFAIAVTNDTGKNELYERKYLNEMAHARSIDSRNTPPIPIQHSPFTDVRNGGSIDGFF